MFIVFAANSNRHVMLELLDADLKEDENNDEANADIEFMYDDTDEYSVEIAELYSYSEEPEFSVNRRCFEEDFKRFTSSKWFEASHQDRSTHIFRLIDRLESGSQTIRERAARALLYLLQGNFGDCELEEDQTPWARRNVYLCIQAGLLPAAVQLLLFQIEYDKWEAASTEPTGESIPKSVASMIDSKDLRIVLSIIYIMVETVRDGIAKKVGVKTDQCSVNASPMVLHLSSADPSIASSDPDAYLVRLREQFVEELALSVTDDKDVTLAVILFGMINRFCVGLAPHFPIKKVLLLLWKVLLITLGPLSNMFAMKNAARARYNLPILTEDPGLIVRRARASSPPGITTDELPARGSRANNRHSIVWQGNQAPKRGSLAHGSFRAQQRELQRTKGGIGQPFQSTQSDSIPTPFNFFFPSNCSETNRLSETTNQDPSVGTAAEDPGMATPRPRSPESNEPRSEFTSWDSEVVIPNSFAECKMLPWRPKVKKKDLETFVNGARLKFLGFHVPNDTTSLIGLPDPIHEAVRVMHDHLYISLGEVQIQREAEISRHPLTLGREPIPDTPTERLYRALYPSMFPYMLALLKLLLAASPTSRIKTEPFNILSEIMPLEKNIPPLQKAIDNFDRKRHRELIVKSISALLLLLLKHFKLNHIYQFEYVSYYLALANCIPLILKFFNQNIRHYVQAKNTLSFMDFPARLIGKPLELTPEMLLSDWSSYCWRNLFSCINLLRILNMLTKWNHSRTMHLVVFKSAPILRRALHLRHAMMQLYILKLLKLQSRYFGRQWRRGNMRIMSAIYQKVRHHLVDDWAYGNDMEAMPWQYQAEENALRVSVEEFNRRRYSSDYLLPEFQPVDNCLTSVLGKSYPLPTEFKQNYEKWLEEEVFSAPINWSHLLAR